MIIIIIIILIPLKLASISYSVGCGLFLNSVYIDIQLPYQEYRNHIGYHDNVLYAPIHNCVYIIIIRCLSVIINLLLLLPDKDVV